MKLNQSFITATIVLLTVNVFSQSLPSSSFTMRLENYSDKIHGETYSKFKIVSANKDLKLPNTSSQKTIYSKSKSNSKIIVIRTGNRKSIGRSSKKFLSDSYLLNLKNHKIKKIAQTFISSKNPANDVSKFVYGHIVKKTLGIPLIPAISVLENRTGDCTEHTVLTVSILRAMGIESRAVVGIILVNDFAGKKNTFVYHMWAEALIDNKWKIVDSTRPMNKKSNTYIAFAYHNLMTETPLKYLSQMSKIYGIKISYMN